MKKTLLLLVAAIATWATVYGQTSFTKATTLYLLHSSGNHLECGTDNGGWIEASTKASPQQMTLTPDGKGYYTIQVAGQEKFLSKTGEWNSLFIADAAGDEAKWTIEQAMGQYVRLRCKANSKYLGSDSPYRHPQLHGLSAARSPALRRLGRLALLVGRPVRQVDGQENRRDCRVAGQSHRSELLALPL